MAKEPVLKLYRGFGHTHDLVLFGHVIAGKGKQYLPHSKQAWRNLLQLINLFRIVPVGKMEVITSWQDETIRTMSEDDGFFWLEWKAAAQTPAGTYITHARLPINGHETTAELVVPHVTQYAFVSDIDDTVMVSHSATGWQRMRELFFKSPSQRKIYEGVAEHYRLLSLAHTTPDQPNPFFYVSSSEWNLYDYLDAFFELNHLPKGVFLLSQLKQWHQLFKTGKTKHQGKLLRILRLFVLFPKQRFVLFGDNSQSDPAIYETLSQKYADRIAAVYIRNVVPEHYDTTNGVLATIQQRGIAALQFDQSFAAITHSKSIGLIA